MRAWSWVELQGQGQTVELIFNHRSLGSFFQLWLPPYHILSRRNHSPHLTSMSGLQVLTVHKITHVKILCLNMGTSLFPKFLNARFRGRQIITNSNQRNMKFYKVDYEKQALLSQVIMFLDIWIQKNCLHQRASFPDVRSLICRRLRGSEPCPNWASRDSPAAQPWASGTDRDKGPWFVSPGGRLFQTLELKESTSSIRTPLTWHISSKFLAAELIYSVFPIPLEEAQNYCVLQPEGPIWFFTGQEPI